MIPLSQPARILAGSICECAGCVLGVVGPDTNILSSAKGLHADEIATTLLRRFSFGKLTKVLHWKARGPFCSGCFFDLTLLLYLPFENSIYVQDKIKGMGMGKHMAPRILNAGSDRLSLLTWCSRCVFPCKTVFCFCWTLFGMCRISSYSLGFALFFGLYGGEVGTARLRTL